MRSNGLTVLTQALIPCGKTDCLVDRIKIAYINASTLTATSLAPHWFHDEFPRSRSVERGKLVTCLHYNKLADQPCKLGLHDCMQLTFQLQVARLQSMSGLHYNELNVQLSRKGLWRHAANCSAMYSLKMSSTHDQVFGFLGYTQHKYSNSDDDGLAPCRQWTFAKLVYIIITTTIIVIIPVLDFAL